jgi:hypothetical protein
MTNEQKAKYLEAWARDLVDGCPPAALLRESAALWRGRVPDDALWEVEYRRKHKRFELSSWPGSNGKWFWTVTYLGLCYKSGETDTLDAAKQAAISWVDVQEGK